MSVRSKLVLPVMLVAALAVTVAVAHARLRSPVPPQVVDTSFHSQALRGPLKVAVFLPAGYAGDSRRYPVVYFLHGLPASPSAYLGASSLVAALGGRAILVAPQGTRGPDPDPEYLDWGPGKNWETALASELPAWVDAHFRTIANRRGRAIVGLSAGGYGAFLIGIHQLARFGAIESWSGYFHPTDPTGTSVLDVGSPDDNARATAHALLPSLKKSLRTDPTFIGFYVGAGDTRFAAENVQLNRELGAAGIPHVFRLYPGGHDQSLWQGKAHEWFGLALAHLQQAG